MVGLRKSLKWLAAIVGSVFFLFSDIFRPVYILSWHLQTEGFVTFDLLLSVLLNLVLTGFKLKGSLWIFTTRMLKKRQRN